MLQRFCNKYVSFVFSEKVYKIQIVLLIFILLFTVPFKFGILGAGRSSDFPMYVPVVIGFSELITACLVVYSKTRKIGGLFGVFIFSGAILAHVFVLGIFYGKILIFLAILGLWFSVNILAETFLKRFLVLALDKKTNA